MFDDFDMELNIEEFDFFTDSDDELDLLEDLLMDGQFVEVDELPY